MLLILESVQKQLPLDVDSRVEFVTSDLGDAAVMVGAAHWIWDSASAPPQGGSRPNEVTERG